MDAFQAPVVEPARLLDVRAVAGLLGVSGRHVYRLADSGRMPRPMKLGGAVRWDRDEIRRWIDAGCPVVVKRKGAER
jgi:prophage regulatory protein